nr:hypothetical protein [Candidatus Kapabacteria bacterium]
PMTSLLLSVILNEVKNPENCGLNKISGFFAAFTNDIFTFVGHSEAKRRIQRIVVKEIFLDSSLRSE